ncbi:MAG: glycine--tRNA ligase subunit beta [Pseudomonadota bacterium]
MPDLLLELFSEEIPARMQDRAADDLKRLVTDRLTEAGLTYAGAVAFSTPRRLALAVDGLAEASPTLREERRGPRVDAPEKAIAGFLRATGLTRDQLSVRNDKKGPVYVATLEKPGRSATEIAAGAIVETVRDFPWPKAMRWGRGSLRWIRPLRSILCLLINENGVDVVPLDIDGLRSSNMTEGHRFMAPGRFAVTSLDDYQARLKQACVILSAEERAAHIWADATNQAFAQGLEMVEDASLLSEVAGLVEWPVVLMGGIEEEFLSLPQEVLQTSMKAHQKFFSVRNPKTGRIEKFVTIANRETADHGETILNGNRKVLAARLSDAKFFWENDLRMVQSIGLEGMAAALSNVTFHNKLGSQAARIARIEKLTREIAPTVEAEADLAARAARVAKADLASEMVYEFPELQGIMGAYYARAAGHDDGVPEACAEHYAPLGPSDEVPTAPVSVAVALADKLDMLMGFWAIDEKPTGSKDPFALRRAAFGAIRLILVNNGRIRLLDMFGSCLNAAASADLLSFLHDRLKILLRDQGMRHDVIDACSTMPGNDDLTLVTKRAEALSAVLHTEEGENLLQGFKRASNILAQAETRDGVEYSFGADSKFATVEEERALFGALEQAEAVIAPALRSEDFATAMAAMAGLRRPIDAFFEAVQINTESEVLRRNRLNLLHRIRAICLDVADLTRIEGGAV